ncbi:MAG: hypothetical protein AAGC93_21430 [Cyanobacteria bacterium P01_F01_bin.53]
MFGQKQPTPPPPTPPRDGIEVSLRISDANFIKLASIVATLLLSSGLLMHSTSQGQAIDPANAIELTTQEDG